MVSDSATTASEAAQGVSGQGIAAKALEVLGTMQGKAYVWGGKTTAGFDCSGFVAYVLSQLLPNRSGSFALNVAGFQGSALFETVNAEDRKPGDLVIFPRTTGGVAHIGIVYDATEWIGSQSSTGVARVKFTNPYWSRRSMEFRRLKVLSPLAVQAALKGYLQAV